MTTELTERVHVWAGASKPSQRIAAELSTLDGSVAAACLIPDVPVDRDIEDLTDALLEAEVGEVLARVLGEVQRVLDDLRGGGRLIFLLPQDVAMGRSHSTAAGAVAGGVLSMARTLAIELRREDITVNTVLFAADLEAAVTRQVAALLTPEAAAISGQEIYVTAGSDLGRRRP